jgi:3D (Asp-Asp-Asp) domain-containing protein
MSLSLAAFLLVSGPATGSARAPDHASREGKTLPATRDTAPPSITVRARPKHSQAVTTHGSGTHRAATRRAGPALGAKSPASTTTTVRHVTTPVPTRPAPSQPARAPLGTFMVTCYDLYGHTADGAVAGMESVAVDPSVIPLGSTIYVPGIGERTADDTGGMIIGDHIDIWEPSYGQCAEWGVRYVPIYRVG